MQKYEVVIVGAGPAGCQCARQLAGAGKKVLLIEKSKDFSINSYSSGGAPLDILQNYQLPAEVVSCHWHKISLHSSQEENVWQASQPVGVVLDFMKLRSFLAAEAQKQGGDLYLGCAYHSHQQVDGQIQVNIKHQTENNIETIQAEVLVDATGAERHVLAKEAYDKSRAMVATGIEYHVEVDSEVYQKYAHTLSFFLGRRWMPQGYAWVFPIEPQQLKIGVIRYFLHDRFVPHEPALRHYLDQMLQHCLGANFSIHEKHGKTLMYTYGQRDCLFRDNIIAIGDCISSLNPLAAEGIRHAMASSNIATKHIINILEKKQSFGSYGADLRAYFGLKWQFSELFMNHLYREPDDHKLDVALAAFRSLSIHELLALGFDYKFSKAAKFGFNYAFLRAKEKLNSWFPH